MALVGHHVRAGVSREHLLLGGIAGLHALPLRLLAGRNRASVWPALCTVLAPDLGLLGHVLFLRTRNERREARGSSPSVPVFTSLKPFAPRLSYLFPPLVAVLIPSPVHARLLKRHAVGFGVVPERAVHVLVAVPGQQQDLQGIAGFDTVA